MLGIIVPLFNSLAGIYVFDMSGPAEYSITLEMPLHEAAGTNIVIGAAVHTWGIQTDSQYKTLLDTHFNSMTPENEMKMGPLRPSLTGFYWDKADYLVEYAENHSMAVHGHTLLWHQQTPSWLNEFAANQSNGKEEWRAMLKNHVQTVAGRYAGRVHAWDVVNEVVDMGADGINGYRNSIWYQKIGPGYINDTFTWVREVDPAAKLYINDYGLCSDLGKLAFTLQLVSRLKAQGTPIDGIGFQAHNPPSVEQIKEAVAMVNQYDLDVWVTELDIPTGIHPIYMKQIAEWQADRFAGVTEAFSGLERLVGITTWGIYDGSSWLHRPSEGEYTWPLLFDESYAPKPCAEAFANALVRYIS